MKYQAQLAIAVTLAQCVTAFPAMNIPLEAIPINKRQPGSISGNDVPDPASTLHLFDPKLQYVSNTGKYAWVAPGPDDARGPCPGLNAMANHGYLPHNGVATIPEFIQGTFDVFGMGVDLAGFLAVLGAALDGDLISSWSIGGPNPAVIGNGLIGSHNKYESDASPMRPDLFEYGNNYEVRLEQFQAFYDMQKDVSNADSNYNLELLQEFRSQRFDQSIQNNPYFFNGPFSGVAVQPAAYTFIYRFMGNKSAEHPEGQLTKEVLKSFFGVTENSDGSLSGGEGQERIPDNWYKRAVGAEYTIPFFILDLLQEAGVYPKFLDIGGNTGTTNTFTGVDVTNLTGGVYNTQSLLQGNNLFCFAYQFAQQGQVDLVDSLLETLAPDAANAILALGCPQLDKINTDMLEQFPGYTKKQ